MLEESLKNGRGTGSYSAFPLHLSTLYCMSHSFIQALFSLHLSAFCLKFRKIHTLMNPLGAALGFNILQIGTTNYPISGWPALPSESEPTQNGTETILSDLAIFWYHWYNYLTGSRWLTQTPEKQGHKKKVFNTQQQWLFTTNLIQLLPVFLDAIMFLVGKCDLVEEEKSYYKTPHLCLSVHLATRGLLKFLQEELCLILWCWHIGKQPHTHNLIKALFYLKFQNDKIEFIPTKMKYLQYIMKLSLCLATT